MRIDTPRNLSKPPPETVHHQGRTPQSGQKMHAPKQREPSSVVNLMDALPRTERGGERRKPAPRAGDIRAPKEAGRSNARQKKESWTASVGYTHCLWTVCGDDDMLPP